MGILKKILDRLPSYTIYDDKGKPYLKRVYLTPNSDWWRKIFPGVFLHFFYQSDADRELHSHPWSRACSVLLTGGYNEERFVRGIWDDESKTYYGGWIETRKLTPGCLNVISHNTFHRIELSDPKEGCWTLFIAGKRMDLPERETWGFINRDGTGWEGHLDRQERVANEASSNK